MSKSAKRLALAIVAALGFAGLALGQGKIPPAASGGGCTGYTGNIEVGLNTLHFVDGCLSTVE